MQRIFFLLIPALLAAAATHAQKAWHGDIMNLIAKVPFPAGSADCYGTATKTTDPSNGIVSIKDNGEQFNNLQAQLMSIASGGMTGMNQTTLPSAPTADQIEQMKQQAMQRAAAAQSMTPQQYAQQQQQQTAGGAPSKSEVELMKEINQAQTAASQISQLCSEIGQKKAKITKDAVLAVKMKNCPDVRQGSYVGPTCECTMKNDIDYYTARVAAMNDYIAQIAALMREYLAKIKAQVTIVDEMEAHAKYGDAVSNPAFKQMAVNIQRQSLNGVTTLLALSGDAWNDGAVEYANLANAKSGAMTHCK
ncbi:MAG TPA: hypothetical protein VMH27_18625 [Puia sp.]|nr:hypothetical protein [Puia sp.]